MSRITFRINGKQYSADGRYGPDVSLNEYIRIVADLKGTKAMCHEGGCGACIVAVRVAQPTSNKLKLFSVNSCLVSVLSCHGWDITTVEGIGNHTIGYHEIQTRLAKFNGTQCGYCTPGWIMNMYCLHSEKASKLTCQDVENSFAGNICRCTGFRSIADAFKSFANDADKNITNKLIDIEELGAFKACKLNYDEKTVIKVDCNEESNDWCILDGTQNTIFKIETDKHNWFKAFKLEEVYKIMSKEQDCKLIAGNTGQGVYHVINHATNIIDIFNVVDLKGYMLDVNLILGAGMTLAEMMEVFFKLSQENEDFRYLEEFNNHMDLVAHIPVRNIGTIGGNLFLKHTNNKFPSDLFVLFESVGAMLTIGSSIMQSEIMNLPMFLKTNMNNKIIINLILPPLSQLSKIKTYKIMQRSQNAHAIVNAGFHFKFKKNQAVIDKATIVYGNIGPTFTHAVKTEKYLQNKDPYTEENLQNALKCLVEEIFPENDPPEPSAKYRKMLAVALYYKAILSQCPKENINERYISGGEVIKRVTSSGTQTFDTDKSVWPLNKPIPKVEALLQCSGEAVFANDLPTQTDEVYGAFVTAEVPPGSIICGFDPSQALCTPGVVAFYAAKDIPGKNTFTPKNLMFLEIDEEILCSKEIKFNGQPVGIIVANREKLALEAAKMVKINYEIISTNIPLLSICDVLKSPERSKRIKKTESIEPTEIGKNVQYVIRDQINLKSQYCYTMETQTSVARPTEDGVEVFSSTQWLNLTNVAVAGCLNVPVNSVNVIVRRVGGGFGGKVTRATQIACAASLVSHLQRKTCRFILPFQTNISVIGGRMPAYFDFEAGVNMEGEIQYLKTKYFQDSGSSYNESITPVTLHHLPSCYSSKRWNIEAHNVLTDKHSTSWCRAPGSTEGVAITEYIMELIAYKIGKDSLEVRLINMKKENNPISKLIKQLKLISGYDQRKNEVDNFNKNNRWRKRAMKLMPLTYDIFLLSPYNIIISIYHADGSIAITHGAVEMGQGLNTKLIQVVSYSLNVPVENISVKPSSSFTSPNCMATGGSVGSECVSYAAVKACEIIMQRLEPIKKNMKNPTWKELVNEAHNAGVNLQASYMFSANEPLKPYKIFCVVALEVEVDILTGNHEVRRVDLLEDVGRSISPMIDVGQIEGAFVMGLGYWTCENLVFDQNSGKLLTDRTWTYKTPGLKDIPADFRVYFQRNSSNKHGVMQSKATGEPALCLAVVVTHAIREAIRLARLDAGYEDQWIDIEYPYTPENIFMAIGHQLEHFKLR